MPGYPFKGDSILARARRLARAYRERLVALDPQGCAELDTMAVHWGETWLVPRILHYDLDDLLSPAEAADVAAVSLATLRQWRHRGRLVGTFTAGVGWRYRARDVVELTVAVRRRTTTREAPDVNRRQESSR